MGINTVNNSTSATMTTTSSVRVNPRDDDPCKHDPRKHEERNIETSPREKRNNEIRANAREFHDTKLRRGWLCQSQPKAPASGFYASVETNFFDTETRRIGGLHGVKKRELTYYQTSRYALASGSECDLF